MLKSSELHSQFLLTVLQFYRPTAYRGSVRAPSGVAFRRGAVEQFCAKGARRLKTIPLFQAELHKQLRAGELHVFDIQLHLRREMPFARLSMGQNTLRSRPALRCMLVRYSVKSNRISAEIWRQDSK